MSTDWRDLVVAATVGTASRPVDLTATPEPVHGAAPPGTDLAGSLLDAAAAFVVARRAGAPPATAARPQPAAADPRPALSPVGTVLLAQALELDADLARTVLDELSASGRRVPGALGPVLLDLAARRRELRPSTRRALGPLAPWLGERNAAWAWATGQVAELPTVFDPQAWETGSRPERVAALRTLRAAEPAAAAALLAGAWRSTAPDERDDLLAALGPVPPPEAEPLLEAALTERRASVRGVAAALLARLPGSALRTRAAARARDLLRIERRGLHRVLVVADPAPFDAAALRDGLEEARTAVSSPYAPEAVGARVCAVVRAAPLAVWGELGRTPAQLVGTAVERYADHVLAGWIDAACNEADPTWVEALLDVARQRAPLQRARAALVERLPPARRTALAVAALTGGRDDNVTALLVHAPAPWDPAIVAAFPRWFRTAAMVPPGRDLPGVVRAAGLALPATAEHVSFLRAAADRAPVGALWARAAATAAETVDLRRRLHEELR